VKYEKPFKTFEEQAEILLSRGLEADKATLISRLETVNYYRISGYLYPFRTPDDQFKPNTSLDLIWTHYTFDRKFRLVVLDAIERLEVAVRTQLAYLHSEAFGPFGYFEATKLPNLSTQDHNRWFSEIKNDFSLSKERFARHFREKYGDSHDIPPIWVAVEQMTLGKTVTFYRGCPSEIQKEIAEHFGVPDVLFLSWLKTLNEVRNVCAHHGRLWNRALGNNPQLPNKNKHPDWHKPNKVVQDKMFVVMVILRFCLRIAAPTSRWHKRVEMLLDEYPMMPLDWMGFPKNWKEHALWL
jgi:abortive infection bacteriophage resistance protein